MAIALPNYLTNRFTRTLLAIAAILVMIAVPMSRAHADACTFTSVANGNWNNPATWSASGTACGTYPGESFAGDAVVISSGHVVTVNVSPANAIASLTFPSGNAADTTVSIGSGITLNVSGTVTIPRAQANPGNIQNTLAVGAGNLHAASIAFTNGGGAPRHRLTISTGTATVTGDVTKSGAGGASATITFTGAGLLKLGGAFLTSGTGALNAGTGTVEYDKAGAQTVGDFTYYNLKLSGSGVKTMAGAVAVGNNLNVGAGTTLDTGPTGTSTLAVTGNTTVNGTLKLDNTGTKTFTGNVAVNSGATWNETGAASIDYGGNLQNGGTYTANSGVHTFSGTGTTIGGANEIAIPNVTVSGTTTNNGTLTVSTALAGAGTLTNGATGTLNFGGSAIGPTLTASAVGNVVNYEAAGGQTVSATAYDSLVFSGSGAKSIASGTSVADNLSIAPTGSAMADIGATLNISVGNLTLGGVNEPYGTWGSTSSTATHQDDTYFTATDGILTVAKTRLTITADNRSKTYGDTVTFLGTEFTTSGLVSPDTVDSVTLTSAGAASSATVAGSPYSIVPSAATGSGLSNYVIIYQNGSLTVNKATAAIVVTPYTVTYNAAAHTATGTATGVFSESLSGLNLTGTTHTHAGDYPSDAWNFTDVTGNYNNASGTTHDHINKANASCTVTGYSVMWDGLPHTATGSCTGVGTDGTLSGLDLSGTTHTNVGDYPNDPWAFTDVSGNYNNQNGSVHDVISTTHAPVITETDPVAVTMNVNGNTTPFSLTLHATDADTGQTATLVWSISGAATNGSASTTATGGSAVINYTPNLNYMGSDSFTVQVQDADLLTDSITVNVTVAPKKLTLTSSGGRDGWVRESGEFTNVGGSKNDTSTTFVLGDSALNQQYRSILSFPTTLPSGAVVTKITLRIKQSGLPKGANPFTKLGNIAVDVKKGQFGLVWLQLTDFQARATLRQAMTILNAPDINLWYSTSLTTGADGLVNKAGNTQFRLRFTKDDNNNFAANYLKFFSGNSITENKPQLIIEYYLPAP